MCIRDSRVAVPLPLDPCLAKNTAWGIKNLTKYIDVNDRMPFFSSFFLIIPGNLVKRMIAFDLTITASEM